MTQSKGQTTQHSWALVLCLCALIWLPLFGFATYLSLSWQGAAASHASGGSLVPQQAARSGTYVLLASALFLGGLLATFMLINRTSASAGGAEAASPDQLIEINNHRIKNSLQMVSSIVNLNARNVQEPEMRARLKEIQFRVLALSEAHNQLSKHEKNDAVCTKQMIGRVAMSVFQSLNLEIRQTPLNLELDKFAIPSHQSVAVCLAATEMIICAQAVSPPQDERLRSWVLKTAHSGGEASLILLSIPTNPFELPMQSTDILTGLAAQLGGTHSTSTENGQLAQSLRFPLA